MNHSPADLQSPASQPFSELVLHAPSYQAEHKSALSADWAHLPIPKDRKLFNRLTAAGEQVTRLVDANRDAGDVIKAVVGADLARTLGPLRMGGRQVRPWKPRPFLVKEWREQVLDDQIWHFLGVIPGASPAEISAARNRLARMLIPTGVGPSKTCSGSMKLSRSSQESARPPHPAYSAEVRPRYPVHWMIWRAS